MSRYLAAAATAGLWLLVAPALFDIDIRSRAADVAHIGGAALVVVAVVAMGEVVRVVRLANVAVGIGVAALVWLTGSGVGFAATTAAATR